MALLNMLSQSLSGGTEEKNTNLSTMVVQPAEKPNEHLLCIFRSVVADVSLLGNGGDTTQCNTLGRGRRNGYTDRLEHDMSCDRTGI
jgi:hypothetical protein